MAKKLSALASPEMRATMELLTKNQLIDAVLLVVDYPEICDSRAVQCVQALLDPVFTVRGQRRVNLAAAYSTIAARVAEVRANLESARGNNGD